MNREIEQTPQHLHADKNEHSATEKCRIDSRSQHPADNSVTPRDTASIHLPACTVTERSAGVSEKICRDREGKEISKTTHVEGTMGSGILDKTVDNTGKTEKGYDDERRPRFENHTNPDGSYKNLNFAYDGTVNQKLEGDGKGNSKATSWSKDPYGAEVKSVNERFANGNAVQTVFHNEQLYDRETHFKDGSFVQERMQPGGKMQAKWGDQEGNTSPAWKEFASDKWHRSKVFGGMALPYTSVDIPNPKD